MEITNITSRRHFSAEKMQKIPLFDSPRMFFDLYCLLPGQSQKVHSHSAEDKIYVVLDGEATFQIGGEEQMLSADQAVIARAGVPHGVRNDSQEELTLLVTMAPRPQ